MITIFSKLFKNETGSSLILFTAIAPALLVAIGILFDTGMLLKSRDLASDAAETACMRAVLPTRTMHPKEETRRQNVLSLFDKIAEQSKLTVNSRDAEVDWLDVALSVNLTYKTFFSSIVGVNDIKYSVQAKCSGIPPFPYDGEIILSTDFKKPGGKEIVLKESYYSRPNCWDIFQYPDFGWDAGTGNGVEIQDWHRCFGGKSGLPPKSEFPSRYVVELDSYDNSTITKTVELHPGEYIFSLWYAGRDEHANSNKISVYLKKLEPEKEKKEALFTLNHTKPRGWVHYKKKINVDTYSVYDVTLAAEGYEDKRGGLINSFVIQYINSDM